MKYLEKLKSITNPYQSSLSNIKLVAFDVDGVLTDGSLHYQADGETTKIFNVKDGVGLKLLADMEIIVAVITAKKSAMVEKRMKDLGVTNFFPGTKDKLKVVNQLAKSNQLSLNQCCYVGDDMVDLPVLNSVGMSICPKDAYPLVQEASSIILEIDGGKGVARLVADLVLCAQDKFETGYQLSARPEFERKR